MNNFQITTKSILENTINIIIENGSMVDGGVNIDPGISQVPTPVPIPTTPSPNSQVTEIDTVIRGGTDPILTNLNKIINMKSDLLKQKSDSEIQSLVNNS